MPSKMSGHVLGLMSGTSLDGIDAAILETDGEQIFSFGPVYHQPYESALRHHLQQAIATPSPDAQQWASEQITLKHLEAISALLQNLQSQNIDLIGFHGQTIAHAPDQGVSLQIGDPQQIAQQTGIDVVGHFRQADIAAGGQGAPLAPLYHLALVKKMRIQQPVAVVNIGGVANITFIDEDKKSIIAFDTGPGNGLMDQWVERHLGLPYDEGGKIAARGKPNNDVLLEYRRDPFFTKTPPKSLDRHDFTLEHVEHVKGLSVEDGMATLLELTAYSISTALDYLPETPQTWVICGGGRHNHTLLTVLDRLLPSPVIVAEKIGWQGDMIEAQCFAFLAVRSVRGLPISLPTTTGCAQPTCGGTFFKAASPYNDQPS